MTKEIEIEIEKMDRDIVIIKARSEIDMLENWIPRLQANLEELKVVLEKEKEWSDIDLYRELESWRECKDYHNEDDNELYDVLEEWYSEITKGE